ncbi:MAG: hypothetical protein M1132_01510 [Chloroflexi bacterium]|nr:hypothetical protein [Chloroflexota bacterium]
MVSVEDSFTRAVHDVIDEMAHRVREVNRPGDLSGLVAYYFLNAKRGQLQIDWNVHVPLIDWLNEHETDFHQSPQLATLGLLLFDLMEKRVSPLIGAVIAFKKGLELLAERQSIFTTPNSWATQPNIVLGITLGISALNDPDLGTWIRGRLDEGMEHFELPFFLRLCYLSGLHALSSGSSPNDVLRLPAINSSDCTLSELALSIWLVRHGVEISGVGNPSDWLGSVQAEFLRRCLVEDLLPTRDEKAAIVLEALFNYLHTRSQYPRLDLVLSLLDNFEPAMERWKSSWPIKDEYDVQALLWLILRSSFDDLRYEEYLPKLGRSGQRYDIGIPPLSLVVEAKYARGKSDFQRFVDEISKDSAQLGTQAAFTGIVVFIYDQSCSVEQHAWAKGTIRKINLVKECVIVSAPSMCQPSKTLLPKARNAGRPSARRRPTRQ